ncbi:FtsH protease activity modulator HflK, partial [Eubacteriales bacterium OttesenSCG-928-G02]|nr:FtsH protease activity modulator HflK [Eubacteriales bacterium OttesenSCG-928-G02]
LLFLVLTSLFTVTEKEQAVIITFGKVTGVVDAGMHFKLPFGIQEAKLVETNVIKKIEIGYRSDGSGNDLIVESESKMITGDFNIVNVDFFVEYQITNPEKYLYNSVDPESILKVLAQSQIRNVIGSYEIDPILTEAKQQIQTEIKNLIIQELNEYDIGLTLRDLRIQDSEPPNAEVNAAFMAVKNADSAAKTALHNANAYKNTRDAEADSEVNKIMENAKYLRQKRINEAKQDVAMFNAVFDEYSKNKDITKTRMYYETIEKVLPGVKIYIETSESGITKLLPLENLMGGN